jgi:single-stranded DNA-specific DHH superfamily exonuclease
MLSEKQILEIKEHLEKAQNPLFFFDNDNDGLASFLLLRRYIGRGKGVVIRSFPELNVSYYRKIHELKPDYVFILDKPVVSKEFIDKIKEDCIPLVWIDHHTVDIKSDKDINYYNPIFNDCKSEPVSYICYKTINKKEDLWISLIGCISDCFLPDFYDEFEKKYPELSKKNPHSAFDLLYNSEIGKIARVLDFALKDSITNVLNMTRLMINIKSPFDLLEENSKTKPILKHFEDIDAKYQKLMIKAREQVENKMLYFQYGGNLSLSSNLANQLCYEYPDKTIVVVFISGDLANISIRGKENIRDLTLKSIENIDGATGGGHMKATGAKMSVSYLPKFKERIEELVNKQ